MSISDDLMYAILAMDSYNQGYGEGIKHNQTNIGTALKKPLSDIIDIQDWKDAGFYAAAYSYNGETVISYRGTNSAPASELAKDALDVWGVGTGNVYEIQGVRAA